MLGRRVLRCRRPRTAGRLRWDLTPAQRRDAFTLPNALTAARIACVPFVAHAIVQGHHVTAGVLFVAAAATDVVDGALARRWNQTSKLGSFLDPLADKIMVVATSGALAWTGALPLPLVVLWLLRDVTLVQGASWHRYRSLPVPKTLRSFVAVSPAGMAVTASPLSKANTVGQVALMTFAIVCGALPPVDAAAWHAAVLPWAVPAVAASTWFSGLQYYLANPFEHLESVGVTRSAERIAATVNVTLLLVGLGFFGVCVHDSYRQLRGRQ